MGIHKIENNNTVLIDGVMCCSKYCSRKATHYIQLGSNGLLLVPLCEEHAIREDKIELQEAITLNKV